MRHIPGSDSRLVAGDEILQTGNFLLLLFISSLYLAFLQCMLLQEIIVISDIACQLAVFNMINDVDNTV